MNPRPITHDSSDFSSWMDARGLSYLDIRAVTRAHHSSVWRWRRGGRIVSFYARVLKVRWPDCPA